eukprot:jgi/Botrbrau1/19186/Bobra.0077s0092.1
MIYLTMLIWRGHSALCPVGSRVFQQSVQSLFRGPSIRTRIASGRLTQPMAQQAQPLFSGPGSEELTTQSCVGKCSKETPKVSSEDLPGLLEKVPSWKLSDDGSSISRSFVAKNFSAALDFFNKVKDIAEAEGHHPDLHLTGYRNVQVVVSTHAIGGLSLPDFILAAKLDTIPVVYSPKWLEKQEQLNQKQ